MTDAQLRACTASAWEGDPSRCRWCNGELSGRQLRWCGSCSNEFAVNHWWTSARRRARKRDGFACVRCGAKEGHDESGEIRRGRDGKPVILQVHHRVQILGRHGETGCHHHLEGLETLCTVCHLEEHHGTRKPTYDQLSIEEVAAA